MHGDSILLATFVIALVAAFLGGILARAARLPPVVGYLLGGLAVGPFTPGFIGDSHAMSQLAEVGVMFMMFGTGLHFSFDDLVAVRRVAVPGALLQTALGTLTGCGLGLALDWPIEAGIMLGLSVSIASTAVLIKNLADAGLADTEGGRIATGWLIVEDLITVVVLVVLPVAFRAGLASSLTIAAGLSQIGEFSFLIGQTGMALGVLTQDQYSLILGAAVLSIALNSFVFKARMPLEHALGGVPALARLYGEAVGTDAPGAGALDGFSSGEVLLDGAAPEGVDAGGLRDSVPRADNALRGGTETRGSRRQRCAPCARPPAIAVVAYSSISSVTGQWSEPKMSLRMPVARTRSAMESLTRK